MSNTHAPTQALSSPIASSERIQALDVVRGFALIGIFLMNIEFFNRPTRDIGQGLPAAVTGADHWAGWLIYTLVQGKFWTMFSLLFGMGFAVMLTRAERADRNFLRPYLRRIAALFVFGTLHHIMLWAGDILVSYSVAAAGLLIVLYGRTLPVIASLVALVVISVLGGMGLLPGADALTPVAIGLMFMGLAALFLRGEGKANFLGKTRLTFSIPFLIVGSAVTLFAAASWFIPSIPYQGRASFSIIGLLLLVIAWASNRFHDPAEPRMRRLGVGMYAIPFTLMTCFGVAMYLNPTQPPAGADAALVAARAEAAQIEAKASATGKTFDEVMAEQAKAADAAAAKAKAGKPKLEGAAKQAAEAKEWAENKLRRERNRAQSRLDVAEEARIESSGNYQDLVKLRAKDYWENLPGEAMFGVILVGMFLLGAWFVRSGVMENTGAHLPLFRRLAMVALPLGVGIGIAAALGIGTASSPGAERDPYQIAMGLTMLANLPACLGYVSVLVLMLHSGGPLAHIRVLAPLGRMALTNYLTHSVVCSLYFYHYGLGHYGMGRATQVGFVFFVIALQVVFSHIWLSFFRYGPMEWLWRAITYWQIPAMRRGNEMAATAA